MNRRQAITAVAALTAGAACTTRSDPNPNSNTGGTGDRAGAAPTAKLRLGFSGLCAFVAEGNNYKAGLLEATGVMDPDNKPFPSHKPVILIDSSVVTGGTQVTGADLQKLRLFTDVTSFQMWSVKDRNVIVDGLPTRKTQASLTGAVPLRDVISGTRIADWDNQSFIQSVVPILGGTLGSGLPRPMVNGSEKSRWKLTGSRVSTANEWKAIGDVPRLLSDTVEYHARVPRNTKITLAGRKAQGNIEIVTTAATDLEIWVLNTPDTGQHTEYEMNHPWELQHVRAFYQLYGLPGTFKVPIADPSNFPSTDPVFCPPVDDGGGLP